jgi:hypothetical protein
VGIKRKHIPARNADACQRTARESFRPAICLSSTGRRSRLHRSRSANEGPIPKARAKARAIFVEDFPGLRKWPSPQRRPAEKKAFWQSLVDRVVIRVDRGHLDIVGIESQCVVIYFRRKGVQEIVF